MSEPSPTPAAKRRRPSFDIAHGEAPDASAGWVYRSDRPMVAPGPEVELIPPGRPVLQRISPEAPATRESEMATLPLTALSIGLGAAMLPLFATMFVMLVPIRWFFGEPSRRA